MPLTSAPKTAIVTGAASGIGAASVRVLLEKGWNVCGCDIDAIATADIGAEAMQRFVAHKTDVADAASCRDAVRRTIAKFGRVDGLIHMAAVHSTKTWRELDAAEFNRTLSINVTGSFLISQAVAEALCDNPVQENDRGAIVLACSGSIASSGVGGEGRGGTAYVSSKAAIIGLVRGLSRSLAPERIRVNAVSPGSTETSMTAHYSQDAIRKVGERALAGRMGKADDIADVAAFLLSDEARYVWGEIVNVNGGATFGL
ncbi:SDR family NAD(P)-dependent oxidoreductase [Roseiarcaceae bacterium H3SJ34-1]|uniref:SDR family NAD(P)-dependent oxidoreductase n=1 Tax=Terripilifer ovatus TaxID=3032367 RepID=UPI003AB9247F|nr:SDR family NAD(P)-dependent oxidoreductase [Roseiarcaceae bacterium H3SJ34-1]